MKVGDLIKHLYGEVPGHGIVITTPDRTLCEVKAVWSDGRLRTLKAGWVKVINESG